MDDKQYWTTSVHGTDILRVGIYINDRHVARCFRGLGLETQLQSEVDVR